MKGLSVNVLQCGFPAQIQMVLRQQCRDPLVTVTLVPTGASSTLSSIGNPISTGRAPRDAPLHCGEGAMAGCNLQLQRIQQSHMRHIAEDLAECMRERRE